MHFQYMTPCLNYSVPLLKADKLWNHPQFRRNRKLVILATGWTNTVNASATIAMISRAFMCRPRVNFVVNNKMLIQVDILIYNKYTCRL